MRPSRRILILSLAAVTLTGILCVGWRKFYSPERIIQGRRESEWIRSLTNNISTFSTLEEEHEKWVRLGPAALPILIKAAGYKEGAMQKAYARIWAKLPVSIQKQIPFPVDYSQFRMAALGRMTWVRIGPADYPMALPLLVRCLGDTNSCVRANAINVLANQVLPQMGTEKDVYLPQLIQATRDTNAFVRMIAAASLQVFSNRTDAVWPALKVAMKDYDADVRIRAAMAAYHLDPVGSSNSGALKVAYDCLNVRGTHGAEYLAEQFLKKIGKYDDRPEPPPDQAQYR